MIVFDDFEAFCEELETFSGIKVYPYRTPKGEIAIPYIVAAERRDGRYGADNNAYLDGAYVDLFLFTYEPIKSNGYKREAESKIKAFLIGKSIPFDCDVTWMENTELFRTEFGLRIFYGKGNS